MDDLNARCAWSLRAFASRGEGVCDMLCLPSEQPNVRNNLEPSISSSSSSFDDGKQQRRRGQQPLVLIAGNGSSLALLDTSRVTRKAFSASVTPTLVASWDMYDLASRELARVDDTHGAKLPARRWMAAHRLSLLRVLGCTSGDGGGRGAIVSRFEVGIVVKCGWMFVAELGIVTRSSGTTTTAACATTSGTNADSTMLRLRLVHRTPRVQCFNSSNERLTTLGGMALQFSLPDTPIVSSRQSFTNGGNMTWVGDVGARRYTLPSKNKYELCEAHGTVTSVSPTSDDDGVETSSSLSISNQEGPRRRRPGEGLILADFDSGCLDAIDRTTVDTCGEMGAERERRFGADSPVVRARLPLSEGRHPLSISVHPRGEWMVAGYGTNNGRGGASTNPVELVCMRKK